jgi:hypothetical protein
MIKMNSFPCHLNTNVSLFVIFLFALSLESDFFPLQPVLVRMVVNFSLLAKQRPIWMESMLYLDMWLRVWMSSVRLK